MLINKNLAAASLRLTRMMSHVSGAESAAWREIRIPVPWGHIAAKEYGTKDKQPILGIHGWQDNCGTFDKLMPLLRLSDRHVVLVDLPGHGFSSHKPPGILYHLFDWATDIRMVIKYLGWKEFSIIAHSMGAGIATLYAAIFPSDVKKLVSLDNVRPSIYPIEELLQRCEKGIDQLISFEERRNRPVSSVAKAEAIDMIVNAMMGSCNKESAEILLRRGAKEVGEGRLVFNRDTRLKFNSVPGLTFEQMRLIEKNIRCEFLLILAKDGLTTMFKNYYDLDKTIEQYRASAKSFEVVEVEGTHHVHLNNPERVATHINRFLSADIDCVIP